MAGAGHCVMDTSRVGRTEQTSPTLRSRSDESFHSSIGHLPGQEGDGANLLHETTQELAQIGQIGRRLALDADQNVEQQRHGPIGSDAIPLRNAICVAHRFGTVGYRPSVADAVQQQSAGTPDEIQTAIAGGVAVVRLSRTHVGTALGEDEAGAAVRNDGRAGLIVPVDAEEAPK